MKICQTHNQLKNYSKQLLENLENEKYYHVDNVWGADLADMQLIRKLNK